MLSHRPKDYDCPFCNFVAGKTTEFNGEERAPYDEKLRSYFANQQP